MEQVLGDYFVYLYQNKINLVWDISSSYGVLSLMILFITNLMDFTTYLATLKLKETHEIFLANTEKLQEIAEVEKALTTNPERLREALAFDYEEVNKQKIKLMNENTMIEAQEAEFLESKNEQEKTKDSLKKIAVRLIPLTSVIIGTVWFVTKNAYKFYVKA